MRKKASIAGLLFRSIFLIFNLLVIAWLLLCKWASLHNPSDHPTFISLFSLTAPLALLANVFFVCYWLCTRKKIRALYSGITLALLWSFIQPLIGINYFSANNLKPEAGDLKVMSWNVHLLDLGAWANDETTKAKIINLIKKENPDVLCLQEFYWDTEDNSMPLTDVIRNLGYPYVSFSRQFLGLKRRITIHADKGATIDIGNIIFSKFPLNNVRDYELGIPHYSMLSAEATVDSIHKVSINVVHLTSVHFGEKEMEYIDEVKKKGLEGHIKSQSKSLLRKLMYAFSNRAILANHIDSLKRFMDYPVIICGDFNDVPSSYVYEKVKGDLADPFVQKGVGFGRTYRNISPTLRIDYIFYDPRYLSVIGYSKKKEKLSDHFPVITNFQFKSPPQEE